MYPMWYILVLTYLATLWIDSQKNTEDFGQTLPENQKALLIKQTMNFFI